MVDLTGQVHALAARISTEVKGLRDSLAGREPAITSGAVTQFWRGDKTWADLYTTTIASVIAHTSTAGTAATLARSDHVHGVGMNPVAATSGLASYRLGVQSFSSNDTTWPGGVAGTIVTWRVSTSFGFQTFVENATGRQWTRAATSSTAWSPWNAPAPANVDYVVTVATTSGGNITSLAGSVIIDGVTVGASGSTPVLVKNQTTASQNGVYLANSGTWTRVDGFSATDSSVLAGGHVRVAQGTVNGGSVWQTSWASTSTVGTTAMLWYRLLTSQKVQSNTVTVSPAASSAQTAFPVVFDQPYATPPNVLVSVNTGSPTVDYKVWVGSSTITTTGFTISFYRANTTAMNITWMALPVD